MTKRNKIKRRYLRKKYNPTGNDYTSPVFWITMAVGAAMAWYMFWFIAFVMGLLIA